MNVLQCLVVYIVCGITYPDLLSARENDVADIQLRYYNGKTHKEFVVLTLANFTKMTTLKGFKVKNSTLIYIHGYEESALSSSVKTIVTAYRTYQPHTNVIVVDWGNMADGGYITNAARNTDSVGRAVGYYLLRLIASGVPSPRIHVVAFSLGCHVAASIARATKTSGITLPRITGLDCAFPMYYPLLAGQRLSPESAAFVDSIHTDSMVYGAPKTTGHVGFWVNGGSRRQPGCPEINIFQSLGAKTYTREFCSHNRSWMYYAESVKNPDAFLGVQCSTYEAFKKKRCIHNDVTIMGYDASVSYGGDFFLQTNDKPPFGRGEDGVTASSSGKRK